ncbi:hypothetical protein DV738_g184, partial [Chaetothyriales sp. CBS 135597]
MAVAAQHAIHGLNGGALPADTAAIIPEIYREKPEEEAQWWKIHLRGTDELSTDDLLALVHHYVPDADIHIQWVNDTSANVVCKGSDNMQNIFLRLVDAADLAWSDVVADPFLLRAARQHPERAATMLQMRVAQAGDRKKKNAAVESRYYLLHPGQDPTERMRQEFSSNRGEYRRRRGDEREQQRRRRRDADLAAGGTAEFSASMYDDAPSSSTADQQTTAAQSRGRDLFARITRRRSASPRPRNASEIDISDSENESGRPIARRNGYRDRTHPRTNDNLNLFPNSNTTGGATPADGPRPATDSRAENLVVAKRLKADLLSAAQTSPRSNHRRSHAMDAKNDEDLAERFARKTLSIDSTRSQGNQGLLIRGGATSNSNSNGNGAPELSIKGRAIEAKELFPHLYTKNLKRSAAGAAIGGGGGGGNEGKELFDAPVREKRVRRRAGDLTM